MIPHRAGLPLHPFLGLTGGLILALAATLSLPPSQATAAESELRRKLERGEPLTCRPVYRVFCANIHVACAGRSTLPTQSLEVELESDTATLAPVGADAADPPFPLEGQASFDAASGDLLVAFPPGNGYFRIEPDGRFSHRIYRRGQALMSRGDCR